MVNYIFAQEFIYCILKYLKADFDDNPDLWKRDQVHEVLTLVEERVDVSRGDAGELGEQVPHLNQTESNRGTAQVVFHFLFKVLLFYEDHTVECRGRERLMCLRKLPKLSEWGCE
jgi:hypothetical protein